MVARLAPANSSATPQIAKMPQSKPLVCCGKKIGTCSHGRVEAASPRMAATMSNSSGIRLRLSFASTGSWRRPSGSRM